MHQEMDVQARQETHPGFTIICESCQSEDTWIENTPGFSRESGQWGELAIRCYNCKFSLAVME